MAQKQGLVLGVQQGSGGNIALIGLVPFGPLGVGAFVDVKSFPNVEGDGINDDGPGIAAAMVAVANTTVSLWFSAGTYRIATRVPLVSNVRCWAGPGAIFKAALAAHVDPNNAMFWFNAPVSNASTLSATPAAGSKTVLAVGTHYAAGEYVFISRAAPNNFQSAIYRVVAANAASPQLLTLDRPIRYGFQAGDLIEQIAPLQNFAFIGNGCLMSGTCDRFVEIAGGVGCAVSGVRADTSLGAPSDIAFSFDQSSLDCSWTNVIVDGDAAIVVGIALESCERCQVIRCAVERTTSSGIEIFDCVNCTVDTSSGTACGAHGVSLTGDGNTIGCSACTIENGEYSANANNGVALVAGTSDCFVRGVTADYNANDGILIGSAGGPSTGNVIDSCTTIGNTGDGIAVGSTANAARSQVRGCVSQQNGDVDLNVGSDCVVDGFASPVMGTFGAIFVAANAGDVLLSGLDLRGTHGPAIECSSGTRVRIVNAEIDAAGVTAIQCDTTSIVNATNVRAGAGLVGVGIAGTATFRQGEGCDFSACATPVVRAASAFWSRSIAATGGVAVPWPDLKAGDQVVAETSTAIPFGITQTPGVGFTIVDATGATFACAVL